MDSAAEFFARAEGPTRSLRFARELERLPDDIGGIVEVVQGLLMHESWAGAYGSSVDPRRQDLKHERSVDAMLQWLEGPEGLMAGEERPPAGRFVCVCRHFAVLAAAILRAKGQPARARCGFAGYFDRSYFCDHWVVEYFDRHEGWRLADAQLDPLQVRKLGVRFDPLDVPRNQFIIAGSAWQLARDGEMDPGQFGFFDERGYGFIGSNVVRDAAALVKAEMLPWDDWAPMPAIEREPTAEQFAFFDQLAELTLSPDARLGELRRMHAPGEALELPREVFNAIRQRSEAVS